LIDVSRKPSASAGTASAPGEAAATAASATPATPATATASAATATTAAAPSYLNATLRSCAVFLVEDVELRQADVGDFFLTERDRVTGREVPCLRLILIRRDRCGCTPYHGKGQPGGS